MKFGAIADIRTGYQFRKRIEHDPAGDVKVILMKDVLDDLSLNTNALQKCYLGPKKGKYLLSCGDVLFKAKGSNNRAGVLLDNIGEVVASSQFLVIRPDKERAVPLYLAWFINQACEQGVFKRMGEGSYIPFVSKAALEEMEVPLPPLDIQQKIVKLYQLQLQEKKLMNQIVTKRSKLVSGVVDQFLRGI